MTPAGSFTLHYVLKQFIHQHANFNSIYTHALALVTSPGGTAGHLTDRLTVVAEVNNATLDSRDWQALWGSSLDTDAA